jgi:adenosylcobinamide kinase/adenosylcobinamide-phosphate guanylyltransferase
LTLWLTNIMLLNKSIDTEIDNLCVLVKSIDFPVVFVSNEVGQGIIPDNALARQFVDWAGQMNQKIAEVALNVIFVTAGLPQILK